MKATEVIRRPEARAALRRWSLVTPARRCGSSEPYPLEYFALREVINEVTVSPDGGRLAMLKILSREGNPILHIYEFGRSRGQALRRELRSDGDHDL